MKGIKKRLSIMIIVAMITSFFSFAGTSTSLAEGTYSANDEPEGSLPLYISFNGNVSAATSVSGIELDRTPGFQQITLDISAIKSKLNGKITSIGFGTVDSWDTANMCWVDEINYGSKNIFHDTQNFTTTIMFGSVPSTQGVVPDEGVDGSPCARFRVSGYNGVWMNFDTPAILDNGNTITLYIDAYKYYPANIYVPTPVSRPAPNAPKRTFEVGPDKTYTKLKDVPWTTLKAGDLVNIYYRSTPYKEKIAILDAIGTAQDQIIIRGIPGPNGELPVLDGNEAVASNSNCDNDYGMVWVGTAYHLAKYVTIENLEICNTNSTYSYTKSTGQTAKWGDFSCGIVSHWCENLTVRNCRIHDCGNGFFIKSYDDKVSRDVLVEGNYLYNNGNNNGKLTEHNSYLAAINTTYQYNHYGPLLSGAKGYGLKDRGSATIVRYNWIDGGRRQVSLDDGEDSIQIVEDPGYDDAFVYGNVLIENDDGVLRCWGDDEIVHFGGDNDSIPDRFGTLCFYNNTVITYRQVKTYDPKTLDPGRTERTCLFYLPQGQRADVRNNIFYAAGSNPAPITLFNEEGIIDFNNNWISTGWLPSLEGRQVFTLNGMSQNNLGTNIVGTNPNFADITAQDFKLADASVCIDKAGVLNPAVIGKLDVDMQYVLQQSCLARSIIGTGMDIGAFESTYTGGPVPTPTPTPAPNVVISVDSISGKVGQQVTVNVRVAANSNMAAGSLNLKYDPAKLIPSSCMVGSLLNETSNAVNTAFESDKIRINWVGTHPINDGGIICTITFDIMNNASEGASDLIVEDVLLGDIDAQSIPTTASKGSVNIIAILLGDVNGDGKVDVRDALRVLKYDAGIESLTPSELKCADVNKDGRVDIFDLLLILKYDAGIINSFV